MNRGHIVYVGRYKDVVVYVGEGKVGRHLHLTSGTSHVYEANRFHFNNKIIDVEVVATGLTKEEALLKEKALILELSPAWNREFNPQYRGWGAIIEEVILKVYGRNSKRESKAKCIKVLRYLANHLSHTGEVFIFKGQLERAVDSVGSLLSRLCSDSTKYYKELGEILEVQKAGNGYKVSLKQEWVNG